MGPGCECSPGHNLQPVPPAIYRKHSALSSGSLPPARGPRSRGQEAVLLSSVRAWHRSQQWLPLGAASSVERGLGHRHDATIWSVDYHYYLCGLGSIARRGAAGSGASATGAGSRQYRGQGPEQPAAFPLCRIYQSIISSRGRRLQGARATTARYGRVSASAGQGARARCGRWPEGAGTGRTSGKPGRCRGAPSGEISGAVEQAEPGSQSAICYSARIRTASTANLWFWRVAIGDRPRSRGHGAVLLAHPPAGISGALSEQGKCCTQEGSGKRSETQTGAGPGPGRAAGGQGRRRPA